MIEIWNYINKNVLMYYFDGVEFFVIEKIEGNFIKRQ